MNVEDIHHSGDRIMDALGTKGDKKEAAIMFAATEAIKLLVNLAVDINRIANAQEVMAEAARNRIPS